ncbi:hypothetical protein AURDEDRAFT_167801 [Auricularia subglabra TFB-10046 SS5]|nr:hypothetical protein AURDEDRAFT_167801 [Auricularia subglabra TFB-10046 SS5]
MAMPTPSHTSTPASNEDYALFARPEGKSELDERTPRRWPGWSGVYMQSADSCEEDLDGPHLDASKEEIAEARVAADVLVSELPIFVPNPGDQVIGVPVDITDLVVLTGLSLDDRDVNPDPRLSASQSALRRYYTRSQARVAATLSEPETATRGVKRSSPESVAESLRHSVPQGGSRSATCKKLRLNSGSSGDLQLDPPVLPPKVASSTHTVGPTGHREHVPSTSADVLYSPVAFSLRGLVFDPHRASAAPRPRPQLPAFPHPVKRRNPRLCDPAMYGSAGG